MVAQKKEEGGEDRVSKTLNLTEDDLAELEAASESEMADEFGEGETPEAEPEPEPTAEPQPQPDDLQKQLADLKNQLDAKERESAGRLGEIGELRETGRQMQALLQTMQAQQQTQQRQQYPPTPEIDMDGMVTGRQLIDLLGAYSKVIGDSYGAKLSAMEQQVNRFSQQAQLGTEYSDIMSNEIEPLLQANPALRDMARQADPNVLYQLGVGLRKMKAGAPPAAAPNPPMPNPGMRTPPPVPPVMPGTNPGSPPAGLTLERVMEYAKRYGQNPNDPNAVPSSVLKEMTRI